MVYLKTCPLLEGQQAGLSGNLIPQKITRTPKKTIQERYLFEFEIPSSVLVICLKFQWNLESHMFS